MTAIIHAILARQNAAQVQIFGKTTVANQAPIKIDLTNLNKSVQVIAPVVVPFQALDISLLG